MTCDFGHLDFKDCDNLHLHRPGRQLNTLAFASFETVLKGISGNKMQRMAFSMPGIKFRSDGFKAA